MQTKINSRRDRRARRAKRARVPGSLPTSYRRCGACGQVSVAHFAPDPPHQQVVVRAAGVTAEVDRGIAPLIRMCWKLGIGTIMSCEDQAGLVWIMFPGPDAEAFLAVAAGTPCQAMRSLHNRVLNKSEPRDDWERWRATRAWQYSARVAGAPPAVAISVRFPRSDIAVVQRRLKRMVDLCGKLEKKAARHG